MASQACRSADVLLRLTYAYTITVLHSHFNFKDFSFLPAMFSECYLHLTELSTDIHWACGTDGISGRMVGIGVDW